MPGISSRLISLVPSKMRLTRASRYCLSAGIVVDEAVAAVDLDVLVDDEVDHLAAGDLQDRRLDRELLERCQHGVAGVRLPCSALSIRPAVRYSMASTAYSRIDHLRELVADRAEARDRLAELSALGGIRRRLADHPPRAAAAHRRRA